MTRSQFHKQAFYLLSVLIAFFIPVYINAVPVLIALLTLNWVIELDFSQKFKILLRRKNAWFTIILYLLYITGMLWTKNYEYGWFDLQVKLSLLLFPLIICTCEIEKTSIRNLFLAFVIGCFVITVISLCTAIVRWTMNTENSFEYTNLSLFIHHSYLSMYLNFAVAIIATGFFQKESIYIAKKYLFIILILFFSFFIFLLQSKMGIITLIVQFLLYSVHLIFRKRQKLLGGTLAILIALLAVLIYIRSERISEIFYWIKQANQYKSYYKHETESTMSRIFIWEACVDLSKENFLVGTGTGDVKDVFLEKYKQEDMTGAYEKGLNAHNQFFQTQISIGIAGILILLAGLLLPFINNLQTKTKPGNKLFLLFIIFIFLNFLVESMLETQAGVIFYAFFNSLLLFYTEEKVCSPSPLPK